MALRSSTYELQALPESSFVKLIHDSGSAGLTGLVYNIASDVLNHQVAPEHSERQRRLLQTLLYMLSYNTRKLQMEPEMVVRLVAALMQTHDRSLNSLSPFVAMYVLRMALSAKSYNGPQIALIPPLFRHLVRTGAYPTANEGLHVVEYMLQYSDTDPQSVMEMVSRTVHADHDRISEQTLQQARSDGTNWMEWAQSQSAKCADATLQQHALRITILSLCCRTWLRLNRTKRFRSALQQLKVALSRADDWAHEHAVLSTASPSGGIVRVLLQTHLVHLAMSSSHNALCAAAESAAFFSGDTANISPRVVGLICTQAAAYGQINCAASVLGIVRAGLEKHVQPVSRSYALVQRLGSTVLLRVLQHYANMHQYADASALFQWVRTALPTEAWELFWPSSLRAELLTCLAVCEMVVESKALCHMWLPGLRVVSDEERRAWARSAPNEPVASQLAAQLLTLLEADSPPGTASDPLPLQKTPSHAPGFLVTAPCVIALVKLFGRAPRFGTPRDRAFAVMVRDYYLMAVPVERRARSELTALAQASLIVDDRPTAAHLLRMVAQRGVDAGALAVLLHGATDAHAEKTLDAFLALPDVADPEDPINNPRLYACIFSRCIAHARFDLADRVYAAGVARGLGGRIAYHARASMLASWDASPRAVKRRMVALIDEGWRPEPRLLHWVIRSLVRGYSPRGAGLRSADRSYQAMGSAVTLFVLGARYLRTVDLLVARFLLYHISLTSKRTYAKMRRKQPQWVHYVNRIAYALRWTPHLGCVPQYAQLEDISVPTTKHPVGTPNPIPRALLRQLVLAYDALHDVRGIHETLAWMGTAGVLHEKAPDTRAEKVFQRILRRAGTCADVSRTKPWWTSAWGAVHS